MSFFPLIRGWKWRGTSRDVLCLQSGTGAIDGARRRAHYALAVSAQTLNHLTLSELVSKLAAREVSSRAVTQACLDQIQRVDPKIRAFISYDVEDALAQAVAADEELAGAVSHAQRPLLGVPIAIK